MDYKIKTKKSFRIVGFSLKEPMTMEECFEKFRSSGKMLASKAELTSCAL